MNPKDNKNLNNPEVLPANNSVDAPQQATVETPVSQPIVSSNLTQSEPRKLNVKKLVLWILAFVLIAPVAYFVIMFILVFGLSFLKMNKLNNHAKGLEKELSSMVFVEGQSINAKGVVNGDFSTAQDDPAQSTWAEGSLEVNKSLVSLDSEVSTNLSKSGFTREGDSESTYYAIETYDKTSNSIIFRYIKGNKAIRVKYKFDKAYTCPKEYACKHTPKSKPTDNIYPAYPVSGFDTLTVTKVHINLSDKSNYTFSSYMF